MALTCTNFCLPGIVLISIMYLQCKFSGVPTINEFKSRFKKLHFAVLIWSFTRLARAISSIWDINILFGMMLEIKTSGKNEVHNHQLDIQQIKNNTAILVTPMCLIVLFFLVEIWPIWYVLDGNFVDNFLRPDVLIEQKDLGNLTTPLLVDG